MSSIPENRRIGQRACERLTHGKVFDFLVFLAAGFGCRERQWMNIIINQGWEFNCFFYRIDCFCDQKIDLIVKKIESLPLIFCKD